MTQEEKAKAYDEAIERAKKAIKYPDKPCFVRVDEIFPDLKESEDERIRKSLISYLHGLGEFEYPNKQTYNNWLTWLEKQGKHPQGKSAVEANEEKVDNANKVESKLKIESGKWYICVRELLDDYGNIAFCKGDVYWSEKDGYLIPCNSNVPCKITYCVDTYFKNWDISDAKDGDVLAFDNNTIVIFKDLYNKTTFHSYCHIEDGVFSVSTDELPDWWEGKGFVPATKEQRDLLFSKIKESGYVWNAEKKELKKIEKNPSWSEEDEEHVNSLLQRLEGLCRKEFATTRFAINEDEDWLKSLKERVQPQSKSALEINNEVLLHVPAIEDTNKVLRDMICEYFGDGRPMDEDEINAFKKWLLSKVKKQ